MRNQQGSLLVESLLAIAFFTVLIISIFPVLGLLTKRSTAASNNATANLLLQEGQEVAYNVIISEWNLPGLNTYFKIHTNGVRWDLTPDPANEGETISNIYTRKIQVIKGCRNSDGELVNYPPQDSSCTEQVDNDTKIITTSISWEENSEELEVKANLIVINQN